MVKIKIGKAEHIKYGFGFIIKDSCGDCREGEVLFMPDEGIFDKCKAAPSAYFGYSRAHHEPAVFDIVLKNELNNIKYFKK